MHAREGARERPFAQLVAIVVLTAVLVAGITRAAKHAPKAVDVRARGSSAVRLAGAATSYLFHPSRGMLEAKALDGSFARAIDVSLVVDGVARPIVADRSSPRVAGKNAFAVSMPVSIGEEAFDALVSMRVDAYTGALLAELTVSAGDTVQPHTFALRFELPTDGRTAFVSGAGELADLGDVRGKALTLSADDADPNARTLGVVSMHTDIDVGAVADDEHPDPGSPLRIRATTAPQAPSAGQPVIADLRFVLASSPMRIWRTLFELAAQPTARITGVVTGATERARVFGLDAEGAPRVLAQVNADGRFDLEVPTTIVEWYAALDPTRTSAPVQFTPGTPWDLRLDVSPGGELHVNVTDADTGEPLTARLIVHGIDGTLDPSFGPDYRASGAGPIIDALRGEVVTPLPAGRYRVAATKGIEWSVDAKIIDVVSGRSMGIDLAPRHVVPTPNLVGCDLHVHARPSFDSPVVAEDRVLSLVSAGVDFAVPSEHNLVGDYAPALSALELTRDLASVTGVEVTTFAPRYGHFGLFPFPTSEKPPPYRGTSINTIFKAAKRSDPNRILQVNHPRLPQGIGYFEIFRFDPKKPLPANMRTDFDTLEVYNGYELGTPLRTEAVLHDWYALLNLGYRFAATGSSDSHRIQYQWAGYPRTMVFAEDEPVDVPQVLASIKKGRGFVTTGPILDVKVEGARPGDTCTVHEKKELAAHVSVRAAPWVDVSSLEVVVGGRSVMTVPIPRQPTRFGPEAGTKDEAQARTLRYDADLSIPVGPESTWVVFLARGERKLDDILPFMPIAPLGFTNPVFIQR